MKLSYAHSQLNPTGWKSADLVNGKADLTIPLSTEQQSGLRTAAQDIVASGQPLDHLTHHIQSMDTLAKTLRRAAHEVDSGRGIVILQGFPLAESSLAEIEVMYWLVGLMQHPVFGAGIRQNRCLERLYEKNPAGPKFPRPIDQKFLENNIPDQLGVSPEWVLFPEKRVLFPAQ